MKQSAESDINREMETYRNSAGRVKAEEKAAALASCWTLS